MSVTPPKPTHAWIPALLAGACLCGCAPEKLEPVRINYFLPSYARLTRIRRAVLIELDEDIRYPGLARHLTYALMKRMQQKELFHVTVRAKDDPLCVDLGLDRPRRYSLTEMARIRKQLNCDAVILGRLVDLKTFPQTQLTLFLAMLDLHKGDVAWAVDDTWDMHDPSVQRRIGHFQRCRQHSPYAPDAVEVARMSPRQFQRFVAFEVAKTLAPPPDDRKRLLKYRQRLELYDVLERGL